MDSNRYIGATKVDGIHNTDKKSPLGKDLHLVTFEGGNDRQQYMTQDLYELVSTEDQQDENYVQKKKMDELIPGLVDLVSEYNLRFYEIGGLMQKTHEEFQERLERASNYVWTGNDNLFVPGYNFTNDISTLDIREVLKKVEDKNDGEE